MIKHPVNILIALLVVENLVFPLFLHLYDFKITTIEAYKVILKTFTKIHCFNLALDLL